jgi:hypothetical protein
MTARRRTGDTNSPAFVLEELAKEALEVAKKARRHHRSLSGDNFYGNKLADLRADATNAFGNFNEQSTGDTAALAELIEAIFAASTSKNDRLKAYRELSFSLRTTWRSASTPLATESAESFFPPTILAQANRGYISAIGRQMNGCYTSGWRDACAVMMRRLLEIVIIEAFETKGVASKIKDADGNYFQLSKLINLALGGTDAPPFSEYKKGASKVAGRRSFVGTWQIFFYGTRGHRDDAKGLPINFGRISTSRGTAMIKRIAFIRFLLTGWGAIGGGTDPRGRALAVAATHRRRRCGVSL